MAGPLLPSGVAVPVANRAILATDISMLAPHCYKQFVEIYGQQSYITVLDMLNPVKQFVNGRDFFHFEERGKLHQKVTVQTAVVAPAAGADVTVVATAGDHYSAGTLSPYRVGEVVRASSSGVEGKIVSVNTTTPSAHSAVIRPLKTTAAFVSAGSANLLAGEMLEFMGVTEAGERSSAPDTIVPLENKISNTTTEIRDVWRQTDRSMIEETIVEFNGQPFYKYRGMENVNRRFLNYKAFKLLKGDSANNLGALGGSLGTQGAIPRTRTGGQTLTYTPGSFSITDMHSVTKSLDFNGGAQEYHWLQDVNQNQEFNDELFTTYNGGAIIWNSVGGSADIAIGYGFASVMIDGFVFHVKKELIFSPEAVYGAAPTVGVPEFRDFGWFVPQKQHTDPQSKAIIPSMRIVYNSVGANQEMKTWESGAYAKEPQGEVAELAVHYLQYCGIEMFGANQFLILEAA